MLANGHVDIVLEQPWRRDIPEKNRRARVLPNGRINDDQLDIATFLKNVIGERMTTRADLEKDVGLGGTMKAVNVGEGAEERLCDCGSGLPSKWELDGQGIPLVRACPKCKKEKLSRYRPEILRPYTQADVDEPIEPDEQEEQTGTGAVAGYATPFTFKKKVREKIDIDGRYVDDMESALKSKRISGLSEDGELEFHGKPCPCGSGLPSYKKFDARGKLIKMVCKKCDRKQQAKIRKYSRSLLKKPIIKPDEEDLQEIVDIGVGTMVAVAGVMVIYRALRDILNRSSKKFVWKNIKLTTDNIDRIFDLMKVYYPKVKDEDLNRVRNEIKQEISNGLVKTIDDLKKYIKSKESEFGKVNEMTSSGAAGAYQTPFAFSKNKDGSKRALDVTKKLGFKVVKSISK